MLAFLMMFLASGHAADGLQVLGPLTHVTTLAPGGSASGTIPLRNGSAGAVAVAIDVQDYQVHADGHTDFAPPGTIDRSNAAWVRFAPDHLVLPPGAGADIAWTIAIPADATPAPGTWWSVLVVAPDTDPTAPEAEGVAVHTVFRYALQMVTEVGEAPPAELAFDQTRLVATDDHAQLQVDVSNPGRRWVTPDVWATVFRDDGTDLGRFDGGRLRLYPGSSGRFAMDLTGLPAGRYTALVVADGGDDAAFGSQLALDLTGLGPRR